MKVSSALMFGSLLSLAIGMQAEAQERYRDEIFSSVSLTRDLTYGQSINSKGQNQALRLDLYEPEDDPESNRPVIVFAHGGGFTGGDKSDDHIRDLCTVFAKRGYITASINYRLRESISGTTQYIAAVTDAMHDAKAAVRWFRANARVYRIDAQRIAIGGSSAGAVTALHAAYEESQGSSGNPGKSSEVQTCIDLWGALIDDSVIDTSEAPLIVIHGTSDSTVPFQEAEQLRSRAETLGLPFSLHALQGEGHAPWGRFNDIVMWSSEFLYRNFIGNMPVPVELVSFSAGVFSNSVILSWMTASKTDNLGFEILRGQRKSNLQKVAFVPGHKTTATPRHYEFRDDSLEPRIYFYRLKQIDTAGSFELSGIVEAAVGIPTNFELRQNHPNPFNPETSISYRLVESALVKLEIHNLLGQTVKVLVDQQQPPGYYTLKWNGTDDEGREVPAGVYLYSLITDRLKGTKRMLLLK